MPRREGRWCALVALTWGLVHASSACNQLLGIEQATVGCLSDEHCGPQQNCLASVCQALRPDAGVTLASDASADAALDANP